MKNSPIQYSRDGWSQVMTYCLELGMLVPIMLDSGVDYGHDVGGVKCRTLVLIVPSFF